MCHVPRIPTCSAPYYRQRTLNLYFATVPCAPSMLPSLTLTPDHDHDPPAVLGDAGNEMLRGEGEAACACTQVCTHDGTDLWGIQ